MSLSNFADFAQIAAAVVLAAAAFAAWKSAGASQKSADATHRAASDARRAANASLYLELMSEYSSPEMGAALTRLNRESGDASVAESWAAGERNADKPSELNLARRQVSHFFLKIARVIDAGMIDDELKRALTGLAGLRILDEKVCPLNKAWANLIDQKDRFQESEKLLSRVFGI